MKTIQFQTFFLTIYVIGQDQNITVPGYQELYLNY
jgi:hypothetical protein